MSISTSSKALDIHKAIQGQLPFPVSPGDLLNLAVKSIPSEAFVDGDFWAEDTEIAVCADTKDAINAMADYVGVTPGLMTYELLHTLKTLLNSGMLVVKDDEFYMVVDIDDEGDVVYERIEL